MTTLDFNADPISSLTCANHTFGLRESHDSNSEQPLGYACLRVGGADAATFLQGQLTADITAQNAGSSLTAALCNPKGRVIAPLDIARFDNNLFGLIVANHLVETVKSTLSRYIMRSKVDIMLWPDRPMVSLVPAEKTLEARSCDLKEAGEFRCRPSWVPDGDATWMLTNRADSSNAFADRRDLDWAHAHVLFGIAPPQPATELQHIPQMLNLDALDGVSMTKGCYTGQEIIARVHHRGSVKRRMRRFVADNKSTITVGDAIENARGSNAGIVVEVATDDHNNLGILAVVKESDFAQDGELSCQSTTLKLWPLPYQI